MIRVEKRPVIFECEGEQLVGIISAPPDAKPIGLLCIVAGGPQYRAGCGRQLVELAEALNQKGFPVMRFDYRGIGDSSGQYQDIKAIQPDLQAAIETFKAEVPGLEKIAFWGGCNAASASMMHGAKFPEVISMILGNPFVSSAETQRVVQRQHYAKRLRDPQFWKKLFSGGFNLPAYFRAFWNRLTARLSPAPTPEKKQLSSNQLMLQGMERFDGSLLLLMSGQSLTSKEFDVLVEKSSAWQQIIRRPGTKRLDIPDADQAFSTQNSRRQIIEAACDWMHQL